MRGHLLNRVAPVVAVIALAPVWTVRIGVRGVRGKAGRVETDGYRLKRVVVAEPCDGHQTRFKGEAGVLQLSAVEDGPVESGALDAGVDQICRTEIRSQETG